MNSNKTTRRGRNFLSLIVLACTAMLGTACGNWDQFGNGPLNPHNTIVPGPEAGLSVQYDLLPPSAANHGPEVGVLVDRNGDYYVSSYDQDLHAYDQAGNWMGTYSLGVDGPRAVPYVHSEWPTFSSQATIFTGAEGGGFYVIDVDKTSIPFTMTLADADTTFGTSESSPKRAQDETVYIAGQWGDIARYEYSSTTGLNRLATLSLGEVVTGAIALYDLDPQFPEEEVLVATTSGNFYVLDHRLSTIIWSETSGSTTGDRYYAGVTVAERGLIPPVALLPIAGRGDSNSGLVRAINLFTQSVEWELLPSQTVQGEDVIEGSVAVLHDQRQFDQQQGGQVGQNDRWGGNTGGVLEGGGNSGGGGFIPDLPPVDVNANNTSPFHATFASTDGFLYGIDIVSGLEIWNYSMQTSGYDAPVVDGENIIYVGDGTSTLHAVEGKLIAPGAGIWMDGSINVGGVSDIVKLGVTNDRGLVVGSGVSAYALFQ